MTEFILGAFLSCWLVLIAVGVAMIYLPAGLVTAGVLGATATVLYHRGGEG